MGRSIPVLPGKTLSELFLNAAARAYEGLTLRERFQTVHWSARKRDALRSAIRGAKTDIALVLLEQMIKNAQQEQKLSWDDAFVTVIRDLAWQAHPRFFGDPVIRKGLLPKAVKEKGTFRVGVAQEQYDVVNASASDVMSLIERWGQQERPGPVQAVAYRMYQRHKKLV